MSCGPAAQPGAVALGTLLVATYPGTSYGIGRACGADGIASEHYEGRAVDWMTSVRDPLGAARAGAFIGWLLAPDAAGHAFANARRLGVMYVIWNDHIWGSYSASAGWRAYSTCAAHPAPGWDTGCHRDHVHISLSWAGAQGRTSFWSGRIAPVDYGPCRPSDLNWAAAYAGPNPSPCPTYSAVVARAGSSAAVAALARFSGATIAPGSTGPVVTAMQKALGVVPDGQFGQLTAAAVSTFRTAHHLPAGSSVDADTWRALLAVPAPAPAPSPASPAGPGGTTAGGTTPGGTTAGSAPARSGGTVTGGAAAGSGAGMLTPFGRLRLSFGACGPAVLALQRALHVTPLSSRFGPVTRAAVIRYQGQNGLPATGIVDAATWHALGA